MSSRRHYLGPGRPLSALSTWQELESAAAGGLLAERQWVELKKGLGPAKTQVNSELARDLAALSTDGGLLIFGITDDHNVVGCNPTTLASRISAVAARLVTPALSPLIHDPIPNPEGTAAVVLVELPASPEAPHMADGRYWGRSAHGKRQLSDPEVRRLMFSRMDDRTRFESHLEQLVSSDPLRRYLAEPDRHGHLYLLAQPSAPVASRSHGNCLDLVGRVRNLNNREIWKMASLTRCDRPAHDPDGEARMSLSVRIGSAIPEQEQNLTYISVKDDHRVVVVNGGATTSWETPQGTSMTRVLQDTVALVTTQAMQFIKEISLHDWAYLSPWRVGLHISHLDNLVANIDDFAFRPIEFANSDYTRTSTIYPASWTDDGEAAAGGLLRGFFRGLGLQNWSLEDVINSHP